MAKMLGTVGQPFCKHCCGSRTKADRQDVKRQARRAEKRETNQTIEDEKESHEAQAD